MVLGLGVAPMGWILILAATITPQWREFPQRPGFPLDITLSDGLWESCVEVASLQDKICQPIPEEMAVSWPIQMMRALTVIAVLGSLLSFALSNLGVRWWAESPNYNLTGVSGLLLLLFGVIYLCATSYMAHSVLITAASLQTPDVDKYHLGACLYLG